MPLSVLINEVTWLGKTSVRWRHEVHVWTNMGDLLGGKKKRM